ncbi:MAG: BlaI/MecI/CopY family transcriptional regulator [Lachnospirales bacterium]
MKRLRLTKSEEALMDLFWKEGRPLTSVDITELSKDSSWSGQYVHKLLKSLEIQGLLSVCG